MEGLAADRATGIGRGALGMGLTKGLAV